MKHVRFFLSENFHFLVVKFSVYLDRRVFVMDGKICCSWNRTVHESTCKRKMRPKTI